MSAASRWTTRLSAIGMGCVLGALLGALLGEVALRVIGFSSPTFVMTDPVLGVAHIPGEEGWQAAEGRAYVRINSAGFRDEERALEKPASAFRIAVVGDSMVEALQVERSESVCAVLERVLRGRLGVDARVEVMNFGVSGYGTGQQYLLVRERVLAYAPDLVLLAFTIANDVSDNLRELKRVAYVPYFTLEGGELTLDASFLSSSEYKTRNAWAVRALVAAKRHSRLVQAIDRFRRRWLGRQRGRNRSVVFAEPPTGRWLRAWEVTEALLIAMRDLVEERGGAFALVTLSSGIQVNADAGVRESYTVKHGLRDLFYPERRLRALAERAGFPILNLAPEFLRVAEAEEMIFHGYGENLGSGHWNERGHEMAGQMIADWLCRAVIPSSRPCS